MKTLDEPTIATSEEKKSVSLEIRPQAGQGAGPLFVVGMWRSGTSLLYALLNQHPDVSLMYEGDLFLLRPMFWLPGVRSGWAKRWQFWNQALTRHKIDLDREPQGPCTLRESCELAYRQTASHKGARIWGEKSPNYYDSLARLATEFPTARFIVIWRSPAAICRSILQAAKGQSSWFNRRGMVVRTLLGYGSLKKGCDELLSLGVPLQQIQYEELVKDPTGNMRQICKFLDVPFHTKIASLQKADRSAIYEGAHHLLVKSGTIVESRGQEDGEGLPPPIKKKINRYVALWRQKTQSAWPPISENDADSTDSVTPSLAERALDRCAYHYFRSFDFAISIVYSFAPVGALKVWRRFAGRGVQRESN
jgi:Sulfotransferase family